MSVDTTAQQLAGSALRSLRRLNPLGRAKVAPQRHVRVLAGIDSLTAGGGNPVSSYIPSLTSRLKRRLGDCGPGLVWFDALQPGFYNGATSGTVTPFLVGNPAWDSGPRSHSLCGLGTSYVGVAGGFAGLDPAATWDRCRVYFELGAGGSFGVVSAGDGATGASVDGTRYPTGELCAVDIYQDGAPSTGIAVFSIAGNVVLFGADFLRDGGGATLSNCGISGTYLSQHASLDDAWGRKWMEMLRPDVYLLNGGMNDRVTLDDGGYGHLIDKLVGRWQSGGTDVMLVRPNDSSDAGSTFLARYDRVLKGVALARGCGFLDDRDALGAYAAAVAAGFMADTVHPNATGNSRRAAAYDKALF